MKIEVYSPTIRRKEMDAVLTAMVEDKIGPGERARLLSQIARERLKFDYCVCLRSPAIALHLALKALGLEDGQGVILSALSPRYYERVIRELRLIPLYCDTLEGEAVLGRESVEKAVAGRSEGVEARAIVAHHTLGYVPDVAGLADLGLPIIEDCSQSFGALCGETPAGNAGVLTILGLEERDMLTCGGGALLYAASRRDSGPLRGLGDLPPEYGLPDMNAAMGVVQFREASRNLEKRAAIAENYLRQAMRTRHKRFIQRGGTEDSPWVYNNYAFALVLETGMKDVAAYARRKEIACESAFENTPVGLALVPPEQCPRAYSLSLRTALFPLYPRLTAAEVEKVARLILTLP